MVNVTFFDTANNIVDIFTGINQNSEMFPLFILAAVFILLFIALQRYPVKQILVYDSLVTTILTALFVVLGWVDFVYVMLPVVILFASIIWVAIDRY